MDTYIEHRMAYNHVKLININQTHSIQKPQILIEKKGNS